VNRRDILGLLVILAIILTIATVTLFFWAQSLGNAGIGDGQFIHFWQEINPT
jgi:uncharacterized membrane protein YraQ (UPF0718 family)